MNIKATKYRVAGIGESLGEAQPMLCKSCSQDIIDKNTFRKPLLKDCKKEIDERIANEK